MQGKGLRIITVCQARWDAWGGPGWLDCLSDCTAPTTPVDSDWKTSIYYFRLGERNLDNLVKYRTCKLSKNCTIPYPAAWFRCNADRRHFQGIDREVQQYWKLFKYSEGSLRFYEDFNYHKWGLIGIPFINSRSILVTLIASSPYSPVINKNNEIHVKLSKWIASTWKLKTHQVREFWGKLRVREFQPEEVRKELRSDRN